MAMPPISLARGVPPPELLPVEELADCARAVLLEHGDTLLNYGHVAGYVPLREWVAERHRVDPARVVLTPGSLPGLAILAQILLAGGRRAIVEAPSYDRPLRILEGLGADIATVPLTDDGLDVDSLAHLLDGPPAFLYAIPTFQNPSGRTYPESTRRELLELAARHDLLILEDDPYRLVSFGDDDPPATLFELAGGDGNVVYAASFSKIVAPGLRVGYLILPPGLVGPVENRAVGTYLSPALSMQAMLFEFLRRGRLDENLARARSILRERRDAILAALDEHFGPRGATWSRPEGGYFVWLDLPAGVSAADVADRAAGVAVVKGADFYPRGDGGASSLRLAYSFVPAAELAEGVARLAAAVPAAAPV